MNNKDFANSLNNGDINNIIIVHGNELFLIDNLVESVLKKYLTDDFKDMNFLKFEKLDDNFDSFYENVITFPFMSEKKIILVEDASFFVANAKGLDDKYQEKLEELINSDYDHFVIIFIIKNNKPDMRKKIVKTLNNKKAVIAINRLGEGELSRHIIKEFEKFNIRISPTNASYISLNCGYLDYESILPLFDVNNEIHKIASHELGKKEVSREAIDLLLTKSLGSTIFKLIDFICEGKKSLAYNMLLDMLESGTAIQVIITMIARQYRMLIKYKVLIKKGYSPSEIEKDMKINSYAMNSLKIFSKKFSMDRCVWVLNELLEIDTKIKNGNIDENVGIDVICNSL